MSTSKLKFAESQISDQKRLVRGEQLLYARSRLRCEDEKFQGKWRALIVAGGAPRGEVKALRELMPQLSITALDIEPRCLEAAIEAGVDEVLEHDLASNQWNGGLKSSVRVADKFDLVNLDLCSNPNPATKQIVQHNWHLVRRGGVFMVTFSYGRDVTEMFENRSAQVISKWDYKGEPASRIELLAEVPEAIRGRIHYLFPDDRRLLSLHSVALYRGANMPMCSLLFHVQRPRLGPISFLEVEAGDYEMSVVYPDAANLYDCPQERIESLRRKFAAIKAAYTRMERVRLLEKSATQAALQVNA